MSLKVHREFNRSLARLTYEERRSVERLLTRITESEVTPGMRVHKVGEFLSLSANMDLRIIASGAPNSATLLYVDHHDKAYEWASRHLGVATSVGVELFSSSVLEHLDQPPGTVAVPLLLEKLAAQYGKSEILLDHISGLSPEWQEWFFQTYFEEVIPKPPPPTTSSFTFSPTDDEALSIALELSSEEWLLFLHPTQRSLVEDTVSRSLVIEGGPGTGKTTVLLSRLLKPVTIPGSVRVLFTYSQTLVKELRRVFQTGRIDVPESCVIANLGDLDGSFDNSHFGYRLDGEQLFRVNERGTMRVPVDEVLIDEFQDSELGQAKIIAEIMKSHTMVTIGVDPGQTIFRKNGEFISRILSAGERRARLSYCYRSSRQIIEAAHSAQERVLQLFEAPVTRSAKISYALSGAPVPVVRCLDMRDQIKACDAIFHDLERRYDRSELALIYLQYPNPAFKGPSKEEAAIKNHPRLGRYYHFAPLTKGREFLAGSVFISETFLARNRGPEASTLRANILHVALSRFRDEMTVVFPETCPISPALDKLVKLSV